MVCVLSCAVVSSRAQAQHGDSGTIEGAVYDQTGAPIKGVRVTVASDTQIGGKKVQYTTEEGSFRFSNLDAGVFDLRAEAPKLRTFIQKSIKVGITAPTEVNPVMEVASAEIEEVKVVQKAPLVSTTTAAVQESYDVDFVDSLPHDNRDVIFQQVPNYSPGVTNGRVRGGAKNQTIYQLDGFNLFSEYPTVKASAAYEIQTAGYGAENAMAAGGVVSLTSRSGSNRFEFELEGTFDNDRFKLLRDNLDSPSRSGDFYIINPTVSGPIIKDKLWYSANVEFLTQNTVRDPDPQRVLPDALPELRLWYKGTVKLTWQATQRNKLSGLFTFDDWWRYYAKTVGTTREAQEDSYSPKYGSGLIWESLLSDSVVLRSQIGYAWADTENYPDSCRTDKATCDFTPGTIQTQYGIPGAGRQLVFGNDPNHDRHPRSLVQIVNRLEFFFGKGGWGEHDLVIKDNLMLQHDTFYKSVPGDYVDELNGAVPLARTTYWSNDPRYDNPHYGWYITAQDSLRNSLSVTDAWRPTRFLTLTPGVAFTNATASNTIGTQVIDTKLLTPSISGAWDATHDGRTVVRGSVSEYVDVDVSAIAGLTNGAQVNQRCQWNDSTQAFDKSCAYSGGATGVTIGSPCGPSGIDATGHSCVQGLKAPRTWEYTFGGEREVVEGLALGADFIYRRFENQYELLETNRLWNGSGTDLAGGGAYRNGRAQTISDLETPDAAHRRYIGITGSISKREGRAKIQGSYTWSRLDGTVLDGTGNLYGDIAPRDIFLDGPLADDHRHEIKLSFSYQVSRWLSASTRYLYMSGLPYNRYFRNDVTGKYENIDARVGVNPGTNINDPADDRALRLPDTHSLNAQLAFNLQPLVNHKLEAFFDVLNVLNLRTTTGVTTTDGPSFGVETDRMPSLRFRIGMRYRY